MDAHVVFRVNGFNRNLCARVHGLELSKADVLFDVSVCWKLRGFKFNIEVHLEDLVFKSTKKTKQKGRNIQFLGRWSGILHGQLRSWGSAG